MKIDASFFPKQLNQINSTPGLDSLTAVRVYILNQVPYPDLNDVFKHKSSEFNVKSLLYILFVFTRGLAKSGHTFGKL